MPIYIATFIDQTNGGYRTLQVEAVDLPTAAAIAAGKASSPLVSVKLNTFMTAQDEYDQARGAYEDDARRHR